MTVIAIGKKNNITFAVTDAMVQTTAKVSSYLDCRVQIKLTEIKSTHQYLFLCGEELIDNGAGMLDYWCNMKGIKLDLFNKSNFLELLKCSDIHRKYSIDIQKFAIITQPSTMVYIIDSSKIKEYIVEHNGKNFILKSQSVFPDGKCILSYAGNPRPIDIPVDDKIIENAIVEIEKEHKLRKTTGHILGKVALNYDFDNRFSSVLFIDGVEQKRRYPYNELSEIYLSYRQDWSYIQNAAFKFTPNIT